jgi:ATP-dependent exoDNAse (exonuclease V) alpha subunit
VTSHSSQGQTADRVLIHVDAEQGGEKVVNRRLAYVAVSRGRYDAQIYTNDKSALAEGLGRDVSRRSALESTRAAEPRVVQNSEPSASPTLEGERTIERDLSPGR